MTPEAQRLHDSYRNCIQNAEEYRKQRKVLEDRIAYLQELLSNTQKDLKWETMYYEEENAEVLRYWQLYKNQVAEDEKRPKTYSLQDILALEPCYTAEEVRSIWPVGQSLTMRDIVARFPEERPLPDIVWLLLRTLTKEARDSWRKEVVAYHKGGEYGHISTYSLTCRMAVLYADSCKYYTHSTAKRVKMGEIIERLVESHEEL